MTLAGIAKHPLTDPSGHLSPCPGERKSAGPISLVRKGIGAMPKLRILSPGQGERWLAKRDGEGVLSAAHESCEIRPPFAQEMSESDSLLRGWDNRTANLHMRAAR